jgi:two-component system OmpR family response regulator
MPNMVLVIEDDHDIAHLLELHLRDIAMDVDIVSTGTGGYEKARKDTYDIIILDLMLPGMNGLEVCRKLREQGVHTPILMLTAKSSELDRVLGLELGADDYLTKPFSIQEMQARVKAMLRRSSMQTAQQKADSNEECITIRNLKIMPERRQVSVAGQDVELTAREFELLLHFARNPGKVYSRAQLLDKVWGYGHDGYEHTVNSHINRLRKKIEIDPARAEYIVTVWGVGYKIEEDNSGQL